MGSSSTSMAATLNRTSTPSTAEMGPYGVGATRTGASFTDTTFTMTVPTFESQTPSVA